MGILSSAWKMKLSYLLAVVCTAFVVVQADITLDDVVVQADIGSGGTRLSVFVFKVKGGKPTTCMYETDKTANCVSEVQVPNGRVTTDSTPKEWSKANGVAMQLLTVCFSRLKESTTPECKVLANGPANGKTGKTFGYSSFFAAVPIIVTATAGARRTVISKTLASKTMTDFVKDVVVTSLKAAAGDNPQVKGGVIDGAMEGYFGYMSAAMLLTSTEQQLGTSPLAVQPSTHDFRKNFAFLEIGGASQQFAWWDDSISTRESAQRKRGFSESRKEQEAAQFLEVQGDMVHQFPKVQDFTFDPRKDKKGTSKDLNHVYAASLLGTGGDRMDIALIKHFMNEKSEKPKMAENFQADPVKTGITGDLKLKTVTNPCFIMKMKPIVHGCWKRGWRCPEYKTGAKAADGKDVKDPAYKEDAKKDCKCLGTKKAASVQAVCGQPAFVWVEASQFKTACDETKELGTTPELSKEEPAPVFKGGKPAAPWDMNVLGDIKTDEALMKFLKRGDDYTITGPVPVPKTSKAHFEECNAALKNIYEKDHSESLINIGQVKGTNPYKYMMKYFKDTLAMRSSIDETEKDKKGNLKFTRNVQPTGFMVASIAVINNMGDTEKKVSDQEVGCSHHGEYKQFCKLKYVNIPDHAANGGCAKEAKAADGDFKAFDISACRAVAEPYQLIEQLMPSTKPVHVTFINNDFAPAAASFVNQGALTKGNNMRLYTTENTFEAEDKMWKGEASGTESVEGKSAGDGKSAVLTPTAETKAAAALKPKGTSKGKRRLL